MDKMKCPVCNRRAFDISHIDGYQVEVSLKCPNCNKFVTIKCGEEGEHYGVSESMPQGLTQKEKIMRTAIDLFMKNGYIETTLQEIADAVGLEEFEIHNDFKNKCSILTSVLDFFAEEAGRLEVPEQAFSLLTKDSTTDDVLNCMYLYFPKDTETYYLKTLHVLFHEHYRNNDVREFMCNNIIIGQEKYSETILKRLIELGALDKSVDVDFWSRLHVCIVFLFAERLVVGIGEMYPKFNGKGMEEMLRMLYDTVFKLHGSDKSNLETS